MWTFYKHIRIFLMLLIFFTGAKSLVQAQDQLSVTGHVLESGSGKPLGNAIVSVSSTGKFTTTDEEGAFSLELPSSGEKLMISLPSYYSTEFYSYGRSEVEIFLVSMEDVSEDRMLYTPIGEMKKSSAVNSVNLVDEEALRQTASSSCEQVLSGRVPGLYMVEHSGQPGHNSWMNIRGISSIFNRNVPLVFIDGMLHEVNFPNNAILEGQLLNPMDIVDVEDVTDIVAIRTGEAQFGSAGSPGMISINTEQKGETSASILLRSYGGIAFAPSKLDVLNPTQFTELFRSQLLSEGHSNAYINNTYPWLSGDQAASEYYRYSNNTDWQDEIFRPAALQKYYLFMKGGDDIATYNISTGYTRHGGTVDQYMYSRYNLRLNGVINITKRLTITPNTKISLTDAYITNNGPTFERNPVTSALLKPPLMHPNEISSTGTILFPLDDVGAFNTTNPVALLENDNIDYERSFQLLSSVKLDYRLSKALSISSIIGTSVNNDRVNVFIPDNGVVQIDSAKNSPMDMVTEFRSTQNHTVVTYKKNIEDTHILLLQGGMRVVANTYKNSYGIALNTPSDDFRSLGQGVSDILKPVIDGELFGLRWVSYFTNLSYNFKDKYYLRASGSYDASSAFNEENRYNFYPSLFGAWRLKSEDFLLNNSTIDDLKLRLSFSQTGNMFGSVYNNSRYTLVGRRFNNLGVAVLDYQANEDMQVEKKSTVNAGLDLALGKKAYSFHLDYYMFRINNLIINQSLPYNFGFVDYFDNGGVLSGMGIEFGTDLRFYLGDSKLDISATATHQKSTVVSMNFINPETSFLIREVMGAEYFASPGNAPNAFYGYKTLGIYENESEANLVTGPNGRMMSAGDVIFDDVDDNHIIDDRDKQMIGDPNPDLFGSLGAGLTRGKLKFNALFTYSIGNDVYNYVRYKMTAMDSYANQSRDVLDRWTTGNTGASLPRAQVGDPNGNNVFSDRWIEDGSYLRLKEFRVSYTTDGIGTFKKDMVFYITGTNLLTITGYSGYDPETMYLNDPYFLGIDYGRIPQVRSVIIGVQISL